MLSVHDACVDRHPSDRLALVTRERLWTFGEIREASARVAGWLRHIEGVRVGARVGIVMGQRAETALLHVACSRIGAIAVPLSPLFGHEGLRARLADAGPKLVVTTEEHAPVVRQATDAPLRTALGYGEPLLGDVRDAESPLWIVYTSGTTGLPKGALLPQRVIAGRMPGFLAAHAPFDAENAIFWSPADWSWIGGLHDSLFAPWHAGAAVVARERRGPFDAAEAYELMARHGVTDAFLPPTALKALMRSGATPPPLSLRVVHSAGEPLAPPVRAWAEKALACAITEVYGLTECAFLVGTSPQRPAPDGSMGRPFPTHTVEIRDEEICAKRGDPTMMLGYWRGEAVAPHLPLDADGWLHTGDVAVGRDGDYFHLGRTDDLIKTGGYRVGPAEVEAALLRHPAVAECAVVGMPDAERGQRVKAFVKRAAPVEAAELQAFVRADLAAHAYPREIEFVDELPMTTSGKIRRRALRGADRA